MKFKYSLLALCLTSTSVFATGYNCTFSSNGASGKLYFDGKTAIGDELDLNGDRFKVSVAIVSRKGDTKPGEKYALLEIRDRFRNLLAYTITPLSSPIYLLQGQGRSIECSIIEE